MRLTLVLLLNKNIRDKNQPWTTYRENPAWPTAGRWPVVACYPGSRWAARVFTEIDAHSRLRSAFPGTEAKAPLTLEQTRSRRSVTGTHSWCIISEIKESALRQAQHNDVPRRALYDGLRLSTHEAGDRAKLEWATETCSWLNCGGAGDKGLKGQRAWKLSAC